MIINKVEICGVNTAKLPLLSEKEKTELFVRIQNGDLSAREEFINGNLRLVLSIIQRFNNRGENADDLFQVGCIGLIKALDNFDTSHGVKFSTYAVPMNVIKSKKGTGEGFMTRKQALCKVLESVKDNNITAKIEEILEDMPLTGWSERMIFDTIDQFVVDNGRVPTTTDFKAKGLPPHTVIKLRFGVNLKEFLDRHYPPPRKLCDSSVYYTKTREEWLHNFKEQYERNKPSSAEGYNAARGKGTPSWGVIANMFGVSKWSEFLAFAEVPGYNKKRQVIRGTVEFCVTSHNPLMEELEAVRARISNSE